MSYGRKELVRAAFGAAAGVSNIRDHEDTKNTKQHEDEPPRWFFFVIFVDLCVFVVALVLPLHRRLLEKISARWMPSI
jgi:hypothetical protein